MSDARGGSAAFAETIEVGEVEEADVIAPAGLAATRPSFHGPRRRRRRDPNATLASSGSAAIAGLEVPRRIGRFAVLRRLGAGGMGTVYAAFDEELARRVAIKLLHTSGEFSLASRDLLRSEAQAMAQLSHPNVVQVYDVGEYEGQIFLVMEYVEGRTLGDWLEETPRLWDEVLRLFIAAGEGLEAAHRAGIVHRDFKPDNVLVSDDGIPKVADFGLARRMAEAIGQIAGTPAYMSPEQHLGRPADARSDIFSFCVALHRCLYGAPPFAGRTFEELRDSVTRGALTEAPSVGSVPARLRAAVRRGMAKTPEERFATTAALLEELRACLPTDRRWSLWIAWGGAAVVGAAGLSALLNADPGPTPAEVAALVGATYDAGRFAADAEWVYPPEEGDPKATAIRRIIDLEHLTGPVTEIAREHADRLRGRFAGELAGLGDHYWEDLRTKPFARDFYAQALIFKPDHDVALRRGRLTPGQIAQLRAQAEVSGFSIDQIAAAAPLRRLAKIDEVDVDALLRELADSCEEHLEAGVPASSAGRRGEGVAPARDAVVAPAGAGEGEGRGEDKNEGGSEGERENEASPGSTSQRVITGPSARVLLSKAEEARMDGQDSEAYRFYSQALVVSPRNVAALVALSDIAFDRGEYAEAADLAERAVEVAPKRAANHRRLGDAYYKLRKIKRAREAFERAVELGDTRAQRRLDLMAEEGL
ncbi:MAG: protein kinase [Nannocystaceae bacterium]